MLLRCEDGAGFYHVVTTFVNELFISSLAFNLITLTLDQLEMHVLPFCIENCCSEFAVMARIASYIRPTTVSSCFKFNDETPEATGPSLDTHCYFVYH